jgi:MOSC domain-containing protein YiiM
MIGKLLGIARRALSRAPMEEVASVVASPEFGISGDCKGLRFPQRQVTILAEEDWNETLAILGGFYLPWATRRANLLVRGVSLPRGVGSLIEVGSVILEVTGQTSPCQQMENAHAGLRKALGGNWRGGVTTRVTAGGLLKVGDAVEVTHRVPEHVIRLP